MLGSNFSVFAVFLEGLLSFFSPCVLPLLPVYIGYLSGGAVKEDTLGNKTYNRRVVLINTIFFIIGISFAFFLLGLGITTVGRFFSGNQIIFARIGGILIVLFGLYQLGFLGQSKLLNGEYRFPLAIEKMRMSPVTATVFGFVISFAWSPCIGPVLSSVLIMAATAQSSVTGFLLIGVYTLGYVIPFIITGLFTTSLLDFFAKNKNVVKYTIKIGGVLLVFIGFIIFTGKMNNITGYLSQQNNGTTQVVDDVEDVEEVEAASTNEEVTENESADSSEETYQAAPDFTLYDQYGQVHSLSDYKGKIVFLNFWATWCPPCKEELPYIQELYEEYSEMDNPDVVFLGVTFPGYGREQDADGVKKFLEENGYTFPVLMDLDASLAPEYYITAYPTTFIINSEGNVLGYIPGGMTKEIMENVLNQARDAEKNSAN